jgi:hypothetical protein
MAKSFNALMRQAFKPQPTQYEIEARKDNARARYHSKRMAEKLGIELTIGRDEGGWNCWVETELDVGDRFCTSWHEVDAVLTECERVMQLK